MSDLQDSMRTLATIYCGFVRDYLRSNGFKCRDIFGGAETIGDSIRLYGGPWPRPIAIAFSRELKTWVMRVWERLLNEEEQS